MRYPFPDKSREIFKRERISGMIRDITEILGEREPIKKIELSDGRIIREDGTLYTLTLKNPEIKLYVIDKTREEWILEGFLRYKYVDSVSEMTIEAFYKSNKVFSSTISDKEINTDVYTSSPEWEKPIEELYKNI